MRSATAAVARAWRDQSSIPSQIFHPYAPPSAGHSQLNLPPTTTPLSSSSFLCASPDLSIAPPAHLHISASHCALPVFYSSPKPELAPRAVHSWLTLVLPGEAACRPLALPCKRSSLNAPRLKVLIQAPSAFCAHSHLRPEHLRSPSFSRLFCPPPTSALIVTHISAPCVRSVSRYTIRLS